MTITRVVQDGVEFFTITETGESGISESGVARLCDVSQQAISKLLDRLVTTKQPPKSLEALAGKDLRLQLDLGNRVGKAHTRLVWLSSEVAAAIIEYYAFESPRKTDIARYSYRKFAKLGVNAWIQGITGWKNDDSDQPKIITNIRFKTHHINQLTGEKYPSTIYRLYLYLHNIGQQGQRPTVAEICKALNISRPTYHKHVRTLCDLGMLPSWIQIETRNYPERFVRDWLQSQLGGEIEVPTPDGPIDLLTEHNIIEVKAIDQWKEEIGHILVKRLNYPELFAGILLFGESDRGFDHIQERGELFELTVGFCAIEYRHNPLTQATEIALKP
jgi:hypothetical protein